MNAASFSVLSTPLVELDNPPLCITMPVGISENTRNLAHLFCTKGVEVLRGWRHCVPSYKGSDYD